MRLIFALFISVMPFRIIRIFLYRTLMGYEISYKARVSWLNILVCEKLVIQKNAGFTNPFNIVHKVNYMKIGENSIIIRFNRFRCLNKVEIGTNAKIGTSNVFFGTFTNHSPFKNYENISVGDKSIITNSHLFDASDQIIIGKDVTIGGKGSQLWTHGFDLQHSKKQAEIYIGNNCYIGSSCIILPGITIIDEVMIGSGTTIAKSIKESGFYISSELIKKGEIPNFRDDSDIIKSYNGYYLRK